MEGVIVRVKKDGELVREFRYPSNLDKEFSAD